MKVTIDTREDSHEEIKKVIKMLQHIVGEEALATAPISQQSQVSSLFESEEASGEQQSEVMEDSSTIAAARQAEEQMEAKEPQSTDDLFAELFSQAEISKMDSRPISDEVEEQRPSKSPYKIEIY